jgi:YcxB-like protein
VISVKRILSFDEYAAANKIAIQHGTRKRQINYFLCLWVNPFIGAIVFPAAVWEAVKTWKAPGDNGLAFGLWVGASAYGLYLLLYPLLFRRKIRTLYKQQELHREWLVELSEEGIHSAIPGLSDSRLEWSYFDSFVETAELFVLVKKLRPVFISLPKRALTSSEQDELRPLLDAHLAKE